MYQFPFIKPCTWRTLTHIDKHSCTSNIIASWGIHWSHCPWWTVGWGLQVTYVEQGGQVLNYNHLSISLLCIVLCISERILCGHRLIGIMHTRWDCIVRPYNADSLKLLCSIAQLPSLVKTALPEWKNSSDTMKNLIETPLYGRTMQFHYFAAAILARGTKSSNITWHHGRQPSPSKSHILPTWFIMQCSYVFQYHLSLTILTTSFLGDILCTNKTHSPIFMWL